MKAMVLEKARQPLTLQELKIPGYTPLAIHEGREIYAFTRDGDQDAQLFARQLGARWCGNSNEMPPQLLDAVIIYAPVGALVPLALRALMKGGIVVCAGIHMSDIPASPYATLWGERSIRSVANLTGKDGEEFLALAAKFPIKTETETFHRQDANLALDRLRQGPLRGAAVLQMNENIS